MAKSKNIKNIAVLSTKGGVGKSVISAEVAAAYLSSKGHQPTIRLLDDFNADDANYTDTAISFERVAVKNAKELSENFRQAIDTGETGVVIDVGGNKTTEAFIEALDLNDLALNDLDLFIIPVADNGISITNALSTLELIQEQESLTDAGIMEKIAICINRVTDTDEDHLRERYFRVFDELIDLHNLAWFAVENLDGIENLSFLFEKTSYEVTQETSEWNEKLTEIIQELAPKDRAGELSQEEQAYLTKVSRQRRMMKVNKSRFKPAIEAAFAKLNAL